MNDKTMARLIKEAVRSVNKQSNGDTWEIVLAHFAVGLFWAGVMVFHLEIHDWILSFFKGAQ